LLDPFQKVSLFASQAIERGACPLNLSGGLSIDRNVRHVRSPYYTAAKVNDRLSD
jgi:hypothetical protein